MAQEARGKFIIGEEKLIFTLNDRIMVFILDGYSNQGIYKLISEIGGEKNENKKN